MAIAATATSVSVHTNDPSKFLSPISLSKFSSFTSLKLSGQLQRISIDTRVSVSPLSRRGVVPLSQFSRIDSFDCGKKTRVLGIAAKIKIVKSEKQRFSNLDELLENADKPILVDFYATWCGPCQFMNPILNEVSATLKDTVQVVKIDTEKYPSIANKYQIEALPTFIIFKDGKPCDRFEGALTANQLIQRIEKALEVKQ